ADLLTLLGDHPVACDDRVAARGIYGDGRASDVEDRVAVQRHEIAVLRNLHAPVAGIGNPGRRVDREPAIALHRDVEAVLGSREPACMSRNVGFAWSYARQGIGAGSVEYSLEADAVGAIADRPQISDVARD